MEKLQEHQVIRLVNFLHKMGCPVCHGIMNMDTCDFDNSLNTIEECKKNWCNDIWLEYAYKVERLLITENYTIEQFEEMFKSYKKEYNEEFYALIKKYDLF